LFLHDFPTKILIFCVKISVTFSKHFCAKWQKMFRENTNTTFSVSTLYNCPFASAVIFSFFLFFGLRNAHQMWGPFSKQFAPLTPGYNNCINQYLYCS
jgi:hypothetical protein